MFSRTFRLLFSTQQKKHHKNRAGWYLIHQILAILSQYFADNIKLENVLYIVIMLKDSKLISLISEADRRYICECSMKSKGFSFCVIFILFLFHVFISTFFFNAVVSPWARLPFLLINHNVNKIYDGLYCAERELFSAAFTCDRKLFLVYGKIISEFCSSKYDWGSAHRLTKSCGKYCESICRCVTSRAQCKAAGLLKFLPSGAVLVTWIG